jgi:MFS family permease
MNAIAPPTTTRNRLPMLALLAANAVSWTGNGITWVAVPWFAYELTGSAGQTSLIGFVTGAATALAALCGGPLVDRVGHKRMSVLADVLSGLTVAAIQLWQHGFGVPLWGLLALAFLGAVLDATGASARDALFPDAIAQAATPRERANSAYQALAYGSELAGPLLAGLLIALLGASDALLVDAVTFGVSALAVWLLVPGYARAETTEAPASYLRDLATGLRFLWRQPLLRTLTLAGLLSNGIGSGLFTVVMLVYIEERYGSAARLGLVIAAGAAGLVAGTLLYGAFGRRLPRRATFLVGYSAFGLQLWVVALAPPLWVILLTFGLRGCLTAPFNPIEMSIMQERVPSELRGRVFSTNTALSWALLPLGFVASGALVEYAGVTWTLLAMASAYAAATLWLLATPALHEMDSRAAGGL